MPKPMEMLRRDHANISKLLRIFEQQLEVFATGERPDYELLRDIVDYFLEYADRVHHPLEDRVYLAIAARDADAAASIGDLEADHDRISASLKDFATIADNVMKDMQISRERFQELARDFIHSERRHMRVEEEKFFPLAEAVLTDEDWSKLEAAIGDSEDPVFGAASTEEFAALREALSEPRSASADST
jgi:hemerythrin-like domain-containing protein